MTPLQSDAPLDKKALGCLKTQLQDACRHQWRNIQEARAWEATFELLEDWFFCRLVLMRMELTGVARRFHLFRPPKGGAKQ